MEKTSMVTIIENNTKIHSLRARLACRKAKSRRIETVGLNKGAGQATRSQGTLGALEYLPQLKSVTLTSNVLEGSLASLR